MAVTGFVVFTDKTQVSYGVLRRGNDANWRGNILNNFGPDDFLINVARLCFGLNMSTTSEYRLRVVKQRSSRLVPLENYVCREVRLASQATRALLTAQVVEDFFFKQRPFSLVRHVAVTVAIVFTAMASKWMQHMIRPR